MIFRRLFTPLHLVLGLVLIALIVADLALAPDRTRREESGVLFAGLDPAEVVRVEIQEPGQRLVLERTSSGWQLDRPAGFPAEARAVSDWLGALSRVLEADRVGRLDTAAEVFGFGGDEEGALVTVTGPRGGRLAVYREGSKPVAARAGSGRLGVHLVPEGSQDVYRATGVPTVRASGERFWNPRLFELAADDVRRLELAFQGRALRLERGPDSGSGGAWDFQTESGPRPAPGLLVAELLAGSQALVLDEVREAEPGDFALFDPPFARWSVESERAGPLELIVGAEAGEGRRYVQRSDWDGKFVAELSAALLDELFGPGGSADRLFLRAEQAGR